MSGSAQHACTHVHPPQTCPCLRPSVLCATPSHAGAATSRAEPGAAPCASLPQPPGPGPMLQAHRGAFALPASYHSESRLVSLAGSRLFLVRHCRGGSFALTHVSHEPRVCGMWQRLHNTAVFLARTRFMVTALMALARP